MSNTVAIKIPNAVASAVRARFSQLEGAINERGLRQSLTSAVLVLVDRQLTSMNGHGGGGGKSVVKKAPAKTEPKGAVAVAAPPAKKTAPKGKAAPAKAPANGKALAKAKAAPAKAAPAKASAKAATKAAPAAKRRPQKRAVKKGK